MTERFQKVMPDSGVFVGATGYLGIAGCCAKTTVAPLDRVKILLQARKEHYKNLGVVSSLKRIVTQEGPVGLYKGNGVQMIRVFPYAALQFTSYEQYKKIFRSHQFADDHPHVVKLAAGSLAGLTAMVITYPLDVVRTRLAFQVKGEHFYVGLVDAVKTMVYLEGGLKSLFRGIVPSVLGMAPYAGISFYSFETMKVFCLEYFPETLGQPCPNNSGGLVLVLSAKFLCGGFAGGVAQTLAYPLDVVRKKMQLSLMLPESHKYDRGWLNTLQVVYTEDGVSKGLFRGLSINYIRITPMVAVSFASYEVMKQNFGLDTGYER